MSFIDKAREKAAELVTKHGDKVSDGLDRGAAKVNAKTDGKYAGRLHDGVAKAKQAMTKLDGQPPRGRTDDDVR